MATNNTVSLQAILDSSKINSTEIAKIQKILDKYKLSLNAEIDRTSLINSLKKSMPSITAEIQKLANVSISVDVDQKSASKSVGRAKYNSCPSF